MKTCNKPYQWSTIGNIPTQQGVELFDNIFVGSTGQLANQFLADLGAITRFIDQLE